MAGVNALSGGEERACYTCGKTGHLREDCSELHIKVRSYLKKQAAAARGRGEAEPTARGAEGQGSLPSALLRCRLWWIVCPVRNQSFFLTSG